MLTKDEIGEWLLENEKSAFRFALSIVENETDANDAVCEAVVKVFEHMDSLRDYDKLKSWFMSIVCNEARAMCRRRQHEILYGDITDIHFKPQVHDSDLWYCVQDLVQPQRRVIILYYYSGYKVWEIAKILHIPEGTVRSRLQRARVKLKEEYVDKHL